MQKLKIIKTLSFQNNYFIKCKNKLNCNWSKLWSQLFKNKNLKINEKLNNKIKFTYLVLIYDFSVNYLLLWILI